jgi:hypothetical protein
VSSWIEIATAFLAYVFVGWVFVLVYLAFQWFMQATDVTMEYNWTRVGDLCHPNFELRNRSSSRTYLVTKIAYRNGADGLVWFDARSLLGKELKPRTINEFSHVAPVRNCTRISECMELQIRVRLQTGRDLWQEMQQPGQLGMGRIQRAAFRLRAWIEYER